MTNEAVMKVRVWDKGQFTIPAKIREEMNIGKDSILEVRRIGKAIVIVPEKMLVSELADKITQEITYKETDLNELLLELREGTHRYEAD